MECVMIRCKNIIEFIIDATPFIKDFCETHKKSYKKIGSHECEHSTTYKNNYCITSQKNEMNDQIIFSNTATSGEGTKNYKNHARP